MFVGNAELLSNHARAWRAATYQVAADATLDPQQLIIRVPFAADLAARLIAYSAAVDVPPHEVVRMFVDQAMKAEGIVA
jgi:hypothetical protein